MATLFKPTRPYPLPANADIVPKDGRPHVRLMERGKSAFYPLSEDGKQYLKPAAKWAADVRFADGRRKRVRFSTNRDAAAVMLADLLKKIEGERSGVRDQYADHRRRPLSELLAEYRRHQADRGNTPKQAEQAHRRCELVFAGCGFAQLSDLDGTGAERWLSERRQLAKRDGGISAQTSNHYGTALKAFGNWLVKARRAAENPFRHLGRVNVEVGIRHQRRPLADEEFARLIAAARSGGAFRGLSGPDRGALYLVAGMTGLRASELASLTRDSFALRSDPPVVVVEAAYSKHRRRDEVPLHDGLIAELRPWLAAKSAGERLWPGKWAQHNEAVDLIKRDLEAARATWIAEADTPADTPAETQKRGASDFLAYRDNEGRVPSPPLVRVVPKEHVYVMRFGHSDDDRLARVVGRVWRKLPDEVRETMRGYLCPQVEDYSDEVRPTLVKGALRVEALRTFPGSRLVLGQCMYGGRTIRLNAKLADAMSPAVLGHVVAHELAHVFQRAAWVGQERQIPDDVETDAHELMAAWGFAQTAIDAWNERRHEERYRVRWQRLQEKLLRSESEDEAD